MKSHASGYAGQMPDSHPLGDDRPQASYQKMKPERIQLFYSQHADWQAEHEGRLLVRSYEFTSFPAAVAFAQFVTTVATELQHAPRLELHGPALKVIVGDRDLGLEDRDLELAEAISRAG